MEATASTAARGDVNYRPLLYASAPGKIILCGEHAVVHGARAVATTIEKRTYAFVDVPAAAASGGSDATQRLVIELNIQSQSRHEFAVSVLQRIASEHFATAATEAAEETPQSVAAVCKAMSARVDSAFPDLFAPPTVEAASSAEREVLYSVRVILVLYLFSLRAGCVPLRLRVHSELPAGAGLGSSASFSAAVSAALYRLKQKQTNAAATVPAGLVALSSSDRGCINRWAYGAEVLLHGTPSGVDNTCIVYGGVISFRKDKQTGSRSIALMNPLPAGIRLLVTNTRVPRRTEELVAAVAARFIPLATFVAAASDVIAVPKVARIVADYVFQSDTERLIQAIGSASDAMYDVIRSCVTEESATAVAAAGSKEQQLVSCFQTHFPPLQSLLTELGVGHSAVDSVIASAACAGLHASKLTGAGGGGCVITAVPCANSTADVAGFIASQRAAGRDCFEATVGQSGVAVFDGTIESSY